MTSDTPCICECSIYWSNLVVSVALLLHMPPSFIDSFSHSFIQSLNRSSVRYHSCIQSVSQLLSHSFFHSVVLSFSQSLSQSVCHSCIHSFIHSLTHPPIYPSIHPSIHPFGACSCLLQSVELLHFLTATGLYFVMTCRQKRILSDIIADSNRHVRLRYCSDSAGPRELELPMSLDIEEALHLIKHACTLGSSGAAHAPVCNTANILLISYTSKRHWTCLGMQALYQSLQVKLMSLYAIQHIYM